MVDIIKDIVAKNMYSIKCPYSMKATGIVVHNTANDASARNEIKYMITNKNEVSFHFAIDDIEVVQGIPLDRNSWNAGDGGNGTGNRKRISIEICYSKSGGEKFDKAEKLAAKFIAQLLKERGWGIDKVTKHQDYNGKYCPHRTLDLGWSRFLNMISKELDQEAQNTPNGNTKTNEELAKEVISGKWGNGSERKSRLESAGYDYNAIQTLVNSILNGNNSSSQSHKPSVDITAIANAVIRGDYGNGQARKDALTKKYGSETASKVQEKVNELLGGSKPTTSSIDITAIAKAVIRGDYGNGQARKNALTKKYGSETASKIQEKVNELCK